MEEEEEEDEKGLHRVHDAVSQASEGPAGQHRGQGGGEIPLGEMIRMMLLKEL